MTLRVAIIIPVHRDQVQLRALLIRLARLTPTPDQVIVAGSALDQASEPSGFTSPLSSLDWDLELPATFPLRKIVGPAGRGAQLDAGAAAALGHETEPDLLLFLHADSVMTQKAWELLHHLLPTGVGSSSLNGSSRPVDGGHFRWQLVDEAGEPLRGWRPQLWSLLVNWRSRLASLPYGDQGYFITAAAWRRVGPFGDLPLMEDVAWWRRVRTQARMVALSAPLGTSARRFQRHGYLSTTVRNVWYLVLYRFGVSPRELHRRYYATTAPQEKP